MVSVGLGRASRGLTAIPVQAAIGRNRERSEAAQRERRAVEGGFLGPRGAPAPHRPEKREPIFGTADTDKNPARGRNLTDPLKARQPPGNGRLSAGPQARLTGTETVKAPTLPARRLPTRPPFTPASRGQ